MKVIRLESPEKALAALFELDDIGSGGVIGGFDDHGEEVEITPDNAITNILESGLWGFCRPET